jgi:phage terminase large subunit-like protein
MARKRARSTTSRPPVEPAIPLEAIPILEEELGRSLEGWKSAAPLHVSPVPSVEGAYFDVVAVVNVVKALRALRHTKGKWAGHPLEPEPWQIVWIIAPVFGWKRPDGRRVVRVVWIEIPRKNGKSTLSSGLALVLLCADGEAGAEVYAAAGSTNQARIVFDEAKKMAAAAPALKGKLRPMRSVIEVPRTGSYFRVLSRMADAAHGLNVHGAVVDEVHVHKSRDLIDAIETGTGAREQPLVIFITTADEGAPETIYAEKHERAVQLSKRVIDDPATYGVIWAATEDEDPFAEEVQRRANPGYGVTVRPDWIREEAEKARTTPTYFATYARLILNRRVRVAKRWLPLSAWDASAGLLKAEELLGRDCWAGLDLSSTTDIAALVLLFPFDDHYRVLPFFWVPEDTILKRTKEDHLPYEAWAREGWIETTPGNVIDYAFIRHRLGELAGRYGIQEVAYDPWNAMQLVLQLQDEDGFTCVPIRQGFASMSSPSKELIAWVLGKKLRHGGNPVLRWMADNLVMRTDPAGNIKPDKDKSSEKIDGLVALIEAVDRVTRRVVPKKSVYEERGMVVV